MARCHVSLRTFFSLNSLSEGSPGGFLYLLPPAWIVFLLPFLQSFCSLGISFSFPAISLLRSSSGAYTASILLLCAEPLPEFFFTFHPNHWLPGDCLVSAELAPAARCSTVKCFFGSVFNLLAFSRGPVLAL